VEVLPLASKASIEDFLKTFSKITDLEFGIVDTNAEFQMKETFEALRRMKQSLHSKSTKLTHHDRTGLDKDQTAEQIHAATASGNETVKISGESPDHVRLRGDNHSFTLRVPLGALPERDVDRAIRLVTMYQEYVERGILSVDAPANADAAIRNLRKKIGDA
jgi:hypothetical protein